MEEINNNPLVSIIVVTYNSAEYVLETLESAKLQTYQNIELIVTDDYSIDKTVAICRKWMDENKERFVRTQMVTAEKNTGIPANINRGIKASKGEFIKSIAGDDTMENEYVSILLPEFKNPKCAVCFTNTNLIDSKSRFIKKADNINFSGGNIFEDIFFLRFWPPAASFMHRRTSLFEEGLYNENIWVEDYLMMMKLTYKYEAGYVDKYLVNYRRHGTNTGIESMELFDSRLQSIEFFKNYPNYQKGKNKIMMNKLLYACRYEKLKAPVEILKNLRQAYNPLFLKSFIYLILYWPTGK